MNYSIVHELPGRLRLRADERFTAAESAAIDALLRTQPGIKSAVSTWRTRSILITFEPEARARVLLTVKALTPDYYRELASQMPAVPSQNRLPGLGDVLLGTLKRIVRRSFLPLPVRHVLTVFRSLPYFRSAAHSMFRHGRLNVSVLDAAAIGTSMLQGDFKTASTVMYLLRLGDELEEWTHRKSRENLSDSLRLNISTVWVREEDGTEREIPAGELRVGDCAVVRQGTMIPADGVVVAGEAAVNQASMTGESEAVLRRAGQSVFAGTIIEEGELCVRVTALSGGTRVDQIARLIDESEARKAGVQFRAERMADSLVPYNFALAGLIWLFTRNIQRASAALMADYSCAIKLCTPLAILSAMSSGVRHGVLIKGGRALESLSAVDTVVFDKTGTLTVSQPSVSRVVALPGYERDEVLRIAACLEEHFPHSLARAVVRQAQAEGLRHEEEHAELQYVVAHGIRSQLRGRQTLIGSAHFIFEDEHIACDESVRRRIEDEAHGATTLYLALGDDLAGVIYIEDPVRAESAEVVRELRDLGVKNVVMLTGDNAHTAAHVASQLGITEYRAELLPAGKIDVIRELSRAGAKIAMVGDGINDSPSLAAADVGISMSSATDIAREVADVVLYDRGIAQLPYARRLSSGAMTRIRRNHAAIIGVNTAIILLGVCGILSPALSALLHNSFTLGTSLFSMTPVDGGRRGYGHR
ncbi:MAG: heavy metal translocating P-type ATPase [Pyramidobacter sp.]|nr:heavy metal translocating P-type ATPase [Pyramidobacter sp.]